MTTLVHISDTHFGTEIPEVVAAIEKAIADINPDIVVLSGDITQRARRAQFEAAAAFMEKIPANTKLVVPGNHDIPLFNLFARFLMPYGNYKKSFTSREMVWNGGDIGIVGFDATFIWRHTRGKIKNKKIIDKVRQIRNSLKPDAVLLAVAHQPLAVAWPEDQDEILIGAEETARLFSKLGIDIVLSGHVHVPLLAASDEYYPQLSRAFILAGAGTAISRRVRPGAPNSFNKIEISNGVVEVTRYQYTDLNKKFTPDAIEKFTSSQSGWKKS